jgi:cytochrome c nitrite reductase small subunit
MSEFDNKKNITLRNRIYLLSALLGILIGLAIFTFLYARGTSYFFDDPETCMNCHIMREQFDSWSHSSHKNAAVCNNCHTPKNMVDKYLIKGVNGFNHSLSFTTGRFREPVQIRGFNAEIVQKNCLRCHKIMAGEMSRMYGSKDLSCVSCHKDAGHMK